MRSFRPQRTDYIPKDATCKQDDQSSAVAYYILEPYPVAVCFGGKRNKPDSHYRYRTHDAMWQAIDKHFENTRGVEAYKKERAAKRKAFVHTLEVGQIMRNSWGYDQTNVDYFQVIEVNGKTVKIRAIGSEVVEDNGGWAGQCKPARDSFLDDKVLTKRVTENNAIKIHDWGSYAFPVGDDETAYWSSYA